MLQFNPQVCRFIPLYTIRPVNTERGRLTGYKISSLMTINCVPTMFSAQYATNNMDVNTSQP
jgi:hypothetical protein